MNLFEPVTVGGTELKNRIMFPPLTTGYEHRDGSMSEQSIAFYERIAQGGAAYIVLGDVSPVNSFSPTPKLYCDEQIAMYRELTARVHRWGAKVGAQIFYPEYDLEALTKLIASGDMDGMRKKLHHDMQHFTNEIPAEKLEAARSAMAACAARAKAAGFDFIQIHGDRLVGTLCSAKLNRRTDLYGGSFENRTRFALELVRAIRQAAPGVGIDYKLTVYTDLRGQGGVSRAEAPQFARMLQDAGVDMLHVAQANHTSDIADTIPPMGVQPYAFFADIARDVKRAVRIPVSTVGRIFTPKMAQNLIESGCADIVGLGRPLLADPDWCRKAKEGRADCIRLCISCNKGCTDHIQQRQFLSCVLNAENGFEGRRVIEKAAVKKRVAVIGGGPAGMEAARVASLRGHEVTLFEKETALGGQLNIACVPPRKDEMKRASAFLEHAVRTQPVHLCMGREAELSDILAVRPDAVIVAVGARSFVPPIQGADGANVCDAWEILAGTQQAFGRTVVIGGGLVGCETAEYLAGKGCSVTIVEMADAVAQGESTSVLPTMLAEFDRLGVRQFTGCTVREITPVQVVCTGRDGGTVTLGCDTVVMAAGAKPAAFDTSALEAAGIPCLFVGDCKEKASDISNAIRTAYDAANSL